MTEESSSSLETPLLSEDRTLESGEPTAADGVSGLDYAYCLLSCTLL